MELLSNPYVLEPDKFLVGNNIDLDLQRGFDSLPNFQIDSSGLMEGKLLDEWSYRARALTDSTDPQERAIGAELLRRLGVDPSSLYDDGR